MPEANYLHRKGKIAAKGTIFGLIVNPILGRSDKAS
jgi:hypothetical protein